MRKAFHAIYKTTLLHVNPRAGCCGKGRAGGFCDSCRQLHTYCAPKPVGALAFQLCLRHGACLRCAELRQSALPEEDVLLHCFPPCACYCRVKGRRLTPRYVAACWRFTNDTQAVPRCSMCEMKAPACFNHVRFVCWGVVRLLSFLTHALASPVAAREGPALPAVSHAPVQATLAPAMPLLADVHFTHSSCVQRVANRPYDEAVDLEGSLDERCVPAAGLPGRRAVSHEPRTSHPRRSVETHVNLSQSIVQSPPGQASGGGRGHAAAQAHGAPYGGERGDSPPRVREDARGEYAGSAAEIPGGSRVGADDAASTLSDSAGGEAGESTVSTGGAIMPAGAYKASDYASLPVSEDIRGLFKYITSYKAHDIKLETVLKPFIPDYMPALGSIDSFIKPARPDGKEEELGLTVVDEPAANQSDPTVLDLQLRALSKKSNLQPTHVRSIEHASRNERCVLCLESWTDTAPARMPTIAHTHTTPLPQRNLQVDIQHR